MAEVTSEELKAAELEQAKAITLASKVGILAAVAKGVSWLRKNNQG